MILFTSALIPEDLLIEVCDL